MKQLADTSDWAQLKNDSRSEDGRIRRDALFRSFNIFEEALARKMGRHGSCHELILRLAESDSIRASSIARLIRANQLRNRAAHKSYAPTAEESYDGILAYYTFCESDLMRRPTQPRNSPPLGEPTEHERLDPQNKARPEQPTRDADAALAICNSADSSNRLSRSSANSIASIARVSCGYQTSREKYVGTSAEARSVDQGFGATHPMNRSRIGGPVEEVNFGARGKLIKVRFELVTDAFYNLVKTHPVLLVSSQTKCLC